FHLLGHRVLALGLSETLILQILRRARGRSALQEGRQAQDEREFERPILQNRSSPLPDCPNVTHRPSRQHKQPSSRFPSKAQSFRRLSSLWFRISKSALPLP